MENLRGKLLISAGGLFDPNFRHTVLLVTEHGDEGALGIVLNRPAEVTVAEAAPELAGLSLSDERLHLGGPVQPEAAVVLGQFAHPDFAPALVFETVGLVGEISPGAGLPEVERAKVFAGYAGWGPGQLERELEESSWIIEPARPEDVFSDRPEDLWANVLRRKGGAYAMLSMMPFDPTSN